MFNAVASFCQNTPFTKIIFMKKNSMYLTMVLVLLSFAFTYIKTTTVKGKVIDGKGTPLRLSLIHI